jgi:hypothetical protein
MSIQYVITNMSTPAKVEHAVTILSTIHLNGTYFVPITIGIDGISLTPTRIGLVRETQRNHELLHFDYVAEWESF